MISNDKFIKVVKKQPKIFESAKTQKITTANGIIFLEKGDKFQLLSIKEQTAESEKLANDIVAKINDNLKDSPIEVKIEADDSSNLNGVKTTSITFKVCIKPEAENELVNLNAEAVDFTPQFDAMLNDVLMNEFGFKSDEIGANKDTNTFWVLKVETEDNDEEEVEQPQVELLSKNENGFENDDLIDNDIEDEEIYTESKKKNKKAKYLESKFVKIILKESEEEENKEDDKEEKDTKKKDKKNKKDDDKEIEEEEEEKDNIEEEDEDDEKDDSKKDKKEKKDDKVKESFVLRLNKDKYSHLL